MRHDGNEPPPLPDNQVLFIKLLSRWKRVGFELHASGARTNRAVCFRREGIEPSPSGVLACDALFQRTTLNYLFH